MTKTEWRWLAAVSLASLLLVEIPYLLAYAQEANGLAFTGVLRWPHDFAQYTAAMREGARSPSWLIHDHFTGEPHEPALMYPLYVALGKLAALLRLEIEPFYHGTEIAARGALLVSIYLWCGAIFSDVTRRRVAFVLVVFSSGMSLWLLPLTSLSDFWRDRYGLLGTDSSLPEVSTFVVLFTAPHLMLGLAGLLLAARSYLASWSNPAIRHPLATGCSGLVVGLTNSFSLVTLCAVLAVHLLVMRSRRPIPRSAMLSGGLACLASTPFLAYNLLVFRSDPFWSLTYGQQNLIPSPPLASLVLGLAPLLALTALGYQAFSLATPERRLVAVWMLLSLVLMYAPVPFQRRFAFGLQPMLGLTAAFAAERIWRWARSGQALSLPLAYRLGSYGVLLAALFGSTAFSYKLMLDVVVHQTDRDGQGGAFQPASLREAGRWLVTIMEPRDVVLAEGRTGNYLAGFVPGRVFVGHWVATLRPVEKAEALRRFYREEDGHQARRDFLAANDIRYVVYGPHERSLGAAWPASSPYLRPVYTTLEVRIYEVAEELVAR